MSEFTGSIKMALKINVPLSIDGILCPMNYGSKFIWNEEYLILGLNQEQWELSSKFSKCICPLYFLHQQRSNCLTCVFIKNSKCKFNGKKKTWFFNPPKKTKGYKYLKLALKQTGDEVTIHF